jgi:hypothetical protein
VQSVSERRSTRLCGAVSRPTINTPVILGENNSTVSNFWQCSTRTSTCLSHSIADHIRKNVSSRRAPLRRPRRNNPQLRWLVTSVLRSRSRYVRVADSDLKILSRTWTADEHLASRATRRFAKGVAFVGVGKAASTQPSVQSKISSDAGNKGHLFICSLEQSNDRNELRDERSNVTVSTSSRFNNAFLNVRY